MGNSTLVQVGVGGVFALLIIREVFGFLKGFKSWNGEERRNNGTIGEQSIEFWRETSKRAMTEVLDTSVVPILKSQTEILARLESRSGKSYEESIRNGYVLHEVKDGVEKIRNSNHSIHDNIQKLVSASGA